MGKPETARVRPGGGEPILAETRTERRGTGIARVPAKRPVAAALPRGESRRGRDRKGDFRREESDDPNREEEGDDPSREEGDDPNREEGDDPRREEDAHAGEDGARVRSGGDDARAREALVPENVGGRDGDGEDDARLRRRREKGDDASAYAPRVDRDFARGTRRLRDRLRDRLRAAAAAAAAAVAAAVAAGVASVATTKAPSPVAASPPPLATRSSPRASSRAAPSTAPSVVALPPERDSVKTLDQLRRKMEMKLDHELEDGWRVEWEPGANGREEKVYYDPAAPGKKLLGDAMALTHVKMRLAALAVQQRAAAEAAAKMAADAKGEERAAAEAYAAVAAKIAVSSDPATMVQLGAEMDAARDALRQKSEWAVFAAEQAASAAQKLPRRSAPSSVRGPSLFPRFPLRRRRLSPRFPLRRPRPARRRRRPSGRPKRRGRVWNSWSECTARRACVWVRIGA